MIPTLLRLSGIVEQYVLWKVTTYIRSFRVEPEDYPVFTHGLAQFMQSLHGTGPEVFRWAKDACDAPQATRSVAPDGCGRSIPCFASWTW